MKLQESGENYLETIFILHKRTGFVRSIDIAMELGFSKPSVSHAVGLLKKDGYLVVGGKGEISLTEKGRFVAEKIYERHRLLRQYLVALGVSEQTAEKDACRIEHVISEESFEKVRQHVQKACGLLEKADGGYSPVSKV
ncbi:metal-dependent transcriptional regulator [Youxingia wuxianensis]|uniref:Metal-dependent transcriptional regulator n=1 Tax=Youxingia wuxianensis TaxID=2763678 RepID=A0A926EMS9_9FIRM|nr:metal-dependent transcriptional regulator [Youxingia wuxianensis]MBC8585230.1 metal-dependent transcriptional regulator [Youxingia wuxianensis]